VVEGVEKGGGGDLGCVAQPGTAAKPPGFWGVEGAPGGGGDLGFHCLARLENWLITTESHWQFIGLGW